MFIPRALHVFGCARLGFFPEGICLCPALPNSVLGGQSVQRPEQVPGHRARTAGA